MDALEARCRARYAAETDPVQREAYALAERAGFDWYHTESSARNMAEHAAQEILALRAQQSAPVAASLGGERGVSPASVSLSPLSTDAGAFHRCQGCDDPAGCLFEGACVVQCIGRSEDAFEHLAAQVLVTHESL